MRSGSVVGADDFILDLQKLGADMEKVKREMLKAGGQEMADAWKREITSRGFEDSGAMLKGVRYQVKARKGGGMRAEITSRGEVVRPSKKGKGSTVTNAAKAFYLHYGTSRIRASHWIDSAEADGEPKATAAMRTVLDDKLKHFNGGR